MNDIAEVIDEQIDIEDQGVDDAPQVTEGEQAPEEQPPKVTFDEAQQEVFNKAIDGKVAKQRDAERESDSLRQQLADAQAQIPQAERPIIPEMPDQYDDDFQEKMVVRDAAMREATAFEQDEQRQVQYNQEFQRQQQQASQDALVKASNDFNDRGKKLGITQAEQGAAWTAIANSGLDANVTAFILQDEQGPNITRYLSKNPQILDNLAQMSPMVAAAEIASNIRAKAVAGGVSVDPPPPPGETANAAGFQEGERGPKGATYE